MFTRFICSLFMALAIMSMLPARASTWLQRGMQEYRRGDYASAARTFRQAAQADPNNDLAHYHLANSLLKTGNRSEAMKEYQRAYALSGSNEMTANCKRVLDLYHVNLPDVQTRSSRATSAVNALTPYTTRSLDELNEMARRKTAGRREMESHQGGPDVFKETPENSGLLKEDWDRWIQNFRLEFNTDLFRELRARAIRRPSGHINVVFSVDDRGRLRSRILRSDANENFNESVLASTRHLDQSRCLRFPHDSKIHGFNFSMGWDYGSPKPMSREEVIALLRSRNGSANLINPSGVQASAGRLNATGTGATLSAQDVAGSLQSNRVGSSLSAGQAGGLALPSFQTNVSAQLLPKKKPVELKAEAGLIETGKKKSKHK